MFCGKLNTPPPIIDPTTSATSDTNPSFPDVALAAVEFTAICVVVIGAFLHVYTGDLTQLFAEETKRPFNSLCNYAACHFWALISINRFGVSGLEQIEVARLAAAVGKPNPDAAARAS
jgi:hypothetical protein